MDSAELAACFLKEDGTPAKKQLGLHFHNVFLSYFTLLCSSMNQPSSSPFSSSISSFQHSSIVPEGGYRERNDCFPSLLLQLASLPRLCSLFLMPDGYHFPPQNSNMMLCPMLSPTKRHPLLQFKIIKDLQPEKSLEMYDKII